MLFLFLSQILGASFCLVDINFNSNSHPQKIIISCAKISLICERNMEMMIAITVLGISLILFQTPTACNASLQIHEVQLHQSHEKVHNEVHDDQLSQLPRKLRFTAEVTVRRHGGQEKVTQNYKVKEDVPAAGAEAVSSYGTSVFNKDQGLKHDIGSNKKSAARTWQQWLEGEDASQYVTMDYSHVKRRPPIHNKSLPVAP